MEKRTLSHYRILGPLGRGGMGEVYLAEDTALVRKVALKILPADKQADPVARQRLLREARAAAALNHSHICTVYEVGEADDVNFIALEYVEGETLRDKLARGPIDAADAIRLMDQVAEAIEEAHRKGIVHRDLKPANIMVTREGQAKVMDFGLAQQMLAPAGGANDVRTTAALTKPGAILGTPDYMAPEQITGSRADARSDIFAFGIVLYEVLAGIHPFHRATEVETLAAILAEPAAPLTHHLPSAPPIVVHALTTMLAKEPDARYQSFRELRADLAAAIRPSAWPTIVVPSRVRRRTRWPAIATSAAVIALAVFAVTRWWHPAPVLAFGARDWLVVAEFQNQTGEDLFDKSLNMPFGVALGQSSYVNVVPPSRIQEELRQMRRPPSAVVDADTAREIAQREHVKLVLAPAISKVGGVYVLSAALVDPVTGASVATSTARAADERQVVNALDELAEQVRGRLGEASAAIAQQDVPLFQATTSSLEALRSFSLGAEKLRAQQFKDARTLFEHALEIDQAFTLARAMLGQLEWQFFDRAKGMRLLHEAAMQTDQLSLTEKYTTRAFDAQARNDLPAAIEAWKALLLLYPDRSGTHNNLGRVYHQLGRLEDAAAEYQAAIKIEPSLMITYYSLNTIDMYDFGDLDAVIAHCRQQIALSDQHLWAHVHLGWSLLGKGQLNEAAAAFERAVQIDRSSASALEGLGYTYRRQGKYREALSLFVRLSEADRSQPEFIYHAGVISRLAGDEPGALKYFAAFQDAIQPNVKRQEPWAVFDLAIVLARLGRQDQARALAERAMTLPREIQSVWRSVPLNFPYVPRPTQAAPGPDGLFDYARLLSVEGKIPEALDALSKAIEAGNRNVIWMNTTEDMDGVSADPRFRALLAKSFPVPR